MGMDEAEFLDRTQRIAEAFRPAAPMNRRDLFAGRVQQIADKGVTLLRNQKNLVPLTRNSASCLITVNSLRISQQGQRLIQAFRARTTRGRVASIDTAMPLAAMEAEVGSTQTCLTIVVANFASITANVKDAALFIDKLVAGKVPVILASFNDPYIGSRFPTVDAYLTPFSSAQTSELAVAKALFGEIPITGHSPVTISPIAMVGAGIQLPARR